MLAGLTALFLAASLVIEAAFPAEIPLGRVLAVTGLVFLVAAILVPYRPPSPQRSALSDTPHYGKTRSGFRVHLRTLDHHAPPPGSGWPARFNAWVAVKISRAVGSMWCAYVFALLALLSLPAVLTAAGYAHFFPRWLVAAGLIALVAWIAQTFLQLVLLSVIMVGQDVMGKASDARAAKTFEDAEAAKESLITALDRLDETTEGGLKSVLDAVNALAARPAAEPVVHVQADPALSDTQIGQVVAAIQKNLLGQAQRGQGWSKGTGA